MTTNSWIDGPLFLSLKVTSPLLAEFLSSVMLKLASAASTLLPPPPQALAPSAIAQAATSDKTRISEARIRRLLSTIAHPLGSRSRPNGRRTDRRVGVSDA